MSEGVNITCETGYSKQKQGITAVTASDKGDGGHFVD